jgi:hypothetical protein
MLKMEIKPFICIKVSVKPIHYSYLLAYIFLTSIFDVNKTSIPQFGLILCNELFIYTMVSFSLKKIVDQLGSGGKDSDLY